MEKEITVIIADDHELLRQGFRTAFQKKGIKILASACNGEELLKLVRKHQPQVVVTDIKMPFMGGIEVTKIIKKEFPHINVIALTAYDEVELIKDMTEAGALGVAIKNAGNEELLNGIRAVSEGREFYCAHITKMLLKSKPEPLPIAASFTNRELEVLKLICGGCSNKEVADELGIHSRTVEFHRANLYLKTGCKNLAQLMVFAARYGLI